jgi:hypothetical protein
LIIALQTVAVVNAIIAGIINPILSATSGRTASNSSGSTSVTPASASAW